MKQRDENGRFIKGHTGYKYWLGKKLSKEIRERMSQAQLKNPSRFWLGKKRPDISRENHYDWKGKIEDGYGYLLIYEPEHPLANKKGYVREHRKVLFDAGIEVKEGDVVHHKNRDKKDNRVENLECMGRSEHTKLHDPERGKDTMGMYI